MEKSKFLQRPGIDLERFDYSLVPDNFVNRDYITIICKKHGPFTQMAQNHPKSCGCKKCIAEHITLSRTKNQTEYEADARKVWKDKYEYDEYVDANSFIKIRCKIHDIWFTQSANQHLRGHEGCPICKTENRSNWQRKAASGTFEEKATIIWNQISALTGKNYRFDYSVTDYQHSQTKVKIKCLRHNEIFEQNPHSHLQGHVGCPLCKEEFSSSKPEKELYQFFKKLSNTEIQLNTRKIISKELDLYLPEYNLAIEYDGLHYHSEIYRERSFHINKTKECEIKGIHLIHIFENEWIYQKEIVKSRLAQIIGKSKYRLYARNCYIKIVSANEERLFLNQNHLQGYIASKICYGLYYKHSNGKEYLVSLMSFGNYRTIMGSKNHEGWELYRFCNKINFSIPGAASKLFKHFLKIYKPNEIISYANRRWSTNNEHILYNRLGFVFESYTTPNYHYIKQQKLVNRFNYRKDILVSKYSCPEEMSEHEFCKQQGLFRIYDCGQLKYVWRNFQK